MTTLKYIFGSDCVRLTRIFGPYGYEFYSIHYLDYKITRVDSKARLKAHSHIKIDNHIVHESHWYKMIIDTNAYINLSFRGLITHQGHLTNRRKKIIREGSLEFRRIAWTPCPKYLPRSVNVFMPASRLCNLSCVINVRVIIADYGQEGIRGINLHCLDNPRVIRQSRRH